MSKVRNMFPDDDEPPKKTAVFISGLTFLLIMLIVLIKGCE